MAIIYTRIMLMEKPQDNIVFNLLHNHKDWNNQIQPILKQLTSGAMDSRDVLKILKTFNERYCLKRKEIFSHRYKKKLNDFQALIKLYEAKLPIICKIFASALLYLQPKEIPMVMSQKRSQTNYRKRDIVYLLLLMFFSLVPQQIIDKEQCFEGRFNNSYNFVHIFTYSEFKTKCIVQYLLLTLKQMSQQKQDQILTIIRNVQDTRIQKIIFQNKQKKMSKLAIQSNERSIQQFNGEIKVDFANRFIGGGCLRDGCVQEEIMFAVHPQLYASTLLCQKMDPNQAMAFIGFKRYFNYSGYGNSTKYESLANVEYKLSKNSQFQQYIVAIDAIKFKPGGRQQYQRAQIDREILKAYVGFSALKAQRRIITGGWGCGVYNGDIQAKLLIQWIAASLADKQIVFCPFGKKTILYQHSFLGSLREATVEETYRILLRACDLKLARKNTSLYTVALESAGNL